MNVLKRVFSALAPPRAAKRKLDDDGDEALPTSKVRRQLYAELDKAQSHGEESDAWRRAVQAIRQSRVAKHTTDELSGPAKRGKVLNPSPDGIGCSPRDVETPIVGSGGMAGSSARDFDELNLSRSPQDVGDATTRTFVNTAGGASKSAANSDRQEAGDAFKARPWQLSTLATAAAPSASTEEGEARIDGNPQTDRAVGSAIHGDKLPLQPASYFEAVSETQGTQPAATSTSRTNYSNARSLEEELDKPRPLWEHWTKHANSDALPTESNECFMSTDEGPFSQNSAQNSQNSDDSPNDETLEAGQKAGTGLKEEKSVGRSNKQEVDREDEKNYSVEDEDEEAIDVSYKPLSKVERRGEEGADGTEQEHGSYSDSETDYTFESERQNTWFESEIDPYPYFSSDSDPDLLDYMPQFEETDLHDKHSSGKGTMGDSDLQKVHLDAERPVTESVANENDPAGHGDGLSTNSDAEEPSTAQISEHGQVEPSILAVEGSDSDGHAHVSPEGEARDDTSASVVERAVDAVSEDDSSDDDSCVPTAMYHRGARVEGWEDRPIIDLTDSLGEEERAARDRDGSSKGTQNISEPESESETETDIDFDADQYSLRIPSRQFGKRADGQESFAVPSSDDDTDSADLDDINGSEWDPKATVNTVSNYDGHESNWLDTDSSPSDSAPEEGNAKSPPPSAWDAYWSARGPHSRKQTRSGDVSGCTPVKESKMYILRLDGRDQVGSLVSDEKHSKKDSKGRKRRHRSPQHGVRKHRHRRHSTSEHVSCEASGHRHKRKHLRWDEA